MTRKDDLIAEAEALGLDTSGTVAELEDRIAAHLRDAAVSAEPSTDLVDAVWLGGFDVMVGAAIYRPGDIIPNVPRDQAESTPNMRVATPDDTKD